MRAIQAVIFPVSYLITAILLAAILAIPIQLLTDNTLPLPKVVSKLTQLLLMLGIIPLWLKFGLSKQQVGLQLGFLSNFKLAAYGLFFGITTLAVVAGALIILRIRIIDPDFNWDVQGISALLFSGLATGCLVALLEETLFRGVLLTLLLRIESTMIAIIISALLYAFLHFLKVDNDHMLPEILHWDSGLKLIPAALDYAFSLNHLESFLSLFTVGCFLATTRILIPHSLALCMGIHAGWVAMIKMTKSATDGNISANQTFFVGDYDGITGNLVTLWITILIMLLYRYRLSIQHFLGELITWQNKKAS